MFLTMWESPDNHTAPLQQPSSEHFRNFDDEANNLMSSLHLDADEEPRRVMGANSRANSVRFDESANQNHFSHLSRPSFDYLSRTSSGLGGLTMGERSASHKSDGRASSAHSIRSGASGRANSLNLDTSYAAADSSRSSQDTPALAPGLAFLGSVPAIIRCWMNTNFKHDALLYAAICSGSYKSFLGLSLIKKLGFEDLVTTDENNIQTVELPVYFPEAVPHPASSRSSSPAPQLPSLTVTFQVADVIDAESKAVQIIIGSDTLRMHSADILFSSNTLTLFDDDRSKLSIPLVRPENAATFNSLRTLDASLSTTTPPQPYSNGVLSVTTPTASTIKYRPPIGTNAESIASSDSVRPASRASERPTSQDAMAARPPLSISLRTEGGDADHSAAGASHRSTSGSPAVWSNWRREGTTPTSSNLHTPSQSSTLDWASASRNRDAGYQRKDTGIKVLKPKSATRAVSSAGPTAMTASPSTESRPSRFFDEGRRKSGGDSLAEPEKRESIEPNAATQAQPKTRSNPTGGGSAFSWLNSSGSK